MSGTSGTSAPRTLERVCERADLVSRPRDDDAPACERLLSHGSPPGYGRLPPRAPLARAAPRAPSGSPSPATRTTCAAVRTRATERLHHAHCYSALTLSANARQPVRCSPRRALEKHTLGRRLRARTAGRRSPRGARESRSSSSRHWTASAPWPGAGSIVSGSSHSAHRVLEPERRTPAAAGARASNSPSRTLRIRVSTLPRIERDSRSGPERRGAVPRGAGCSSRRLRPSGGRRGRGRRETTRQSRTSSREADGAERDARRVLRRQGP